MIPEEILNYEIIRKIGEGGMGQVYLAKNKSIGQYVAIKVLHPRFSNNPTVRDRFRQEAIMLSSLNHPNIVKFLNYVENELGVFLIMEYVEGQTLEDFINKTNGLIVESRAYPMFRQILSAFSYAHSRGIIHRDIKPGNIFITPEGQVKVLDFGIAAILSEAEGYTGVTGGTSEYMSPEQVLEKKPDIRSDIYSLGVMFYQMLTGKAPYDSKNLSDIEVKSRVVNSPLRRMKEYYPYISDDIQEIVDCATEKNPADRYADCGEMLDDIDRIYTPHKRRKYIWTGVVAAVLLLGGAGVWIWDYNRTKVRYYRDYVERMEIPEGIGELSGREVKARNYSYRMEYRRGKLRRLTRVNSAGTPVAEKNLFRPSRCGDVEFFYTDNGKIDYKKVYDETGKVLMKMDYDDGLNSVTYKYDDEYETPMRIGLLSEDYYKNLREGGIPTPSISKMLLKHDPESGYLLQVRYAGTHNEPISYYGDSFGYEYGYEEGRPVRVTPLGAGGTPMSGSITTRYSYDENGNRDYVTFWNSDGTEADGLYGIHAINYVFDRNGNVVRERYLNKDMKLMESPVAGVAGYEYIYSDKGFKVCDSYINSSGQKGRDRDGNLSVLYNVDSNGRETRREYMLDGQKPGWGKWYGDSVSSVTTAYDSLGHVSRISYYGPNGLPQELKDGAAAIAMEYDSVGNLIRELYYDGPGRPRKSNGLYAARNLKYDKYGRMVSERYTDFNGAAALSRDGVYGVDYIFDNGGNVSEVKFLGADGKTLMNSKRGYARIQLKYDSDGNCVSVVYNDMNGMTVNGNGNQTAKVGRATRNAKGMRKATGVYIDILNRVDGGRPKKSKSSSKSPAGNNKHLNHRNVKMM